MVMVASRVHTQTQLITALSGVEGWAVDDRASWVSSLGRLNAFRNIANSPCELPRERVKGRLHILHVAQSIVQDGL